MEDEMTERDHDMDEQLSSDRPSREEINADDSMGQPGERGFSLTGMTDDAAAVIPPEASGGQQTDDGTPVGRSDVDADAERSGAND